MKKIVGDYKSDILIDENDLENEWINQPSLYLHYAEAHTAALHIKDTNKLKLEYACAKIDSSVRKDWKKYFDSKPTESAIKNYILSHPTIRQAERAYIDSTEQANLLNGVRNSFEHRKRALENLVSLKISGFHSEPRNKTKDLKNKGGHKERQQALNKSKSKEMSHKTKRNIRRKK